MIERQAQLRAGRGALEWSLPLEIAQHLSRPYHDLAGQSSELSHVDAVTAVGSAFHHLVQEDDALAFLPNLHAEIAEARKSLGQPGQLVVVRRGQRQRLQL